MIPPDKLRALLADHPPQAYMSKDQEKIRDVWDAAREMLAERDDISALALKRLAVMTDDERASFFFDIGAEYKTCCGAKRLGWCACNMEE